jgi:hypothetical protein
VHITPFFARYLPATFLMEYMTKRNEGYITLGNSKDTSEFCCECLKDWWMKYGRINYPNTSSILILADGGGSNSNRH